MARTKDNQEGTETMTIVVEQPATKTEAVRWALNALGRDALPAQIRDYVADHYGLDMSLNHVSNIKSGLSKGTSGTGKPSRKKPGPKPRAEAGIDVSAPTRRRAGSGVSLEDIEAAKQLAERVGVQELHALIDLVAG